MTGWSQPAQSPHSPPASSSAAAPEDALEATAGEVGQTVRVEEGEAVLERVFTQSGGERGEQAGRVAEHLLPRAAACSCCRAQIAARASCCVAGRRWRHLSKAGLLLDGLRQSAPRRQ